MICLLLRVRAVLLDKDDDDAVQLAVKPSEELGSDSDSSITKKNGIGRNSISSCAIGLIVLGFMFYALVL
jgi:hypothetical protein